MDTVAQEKPMVIPQSKWARILYGLIVIVLPTACFYLGEALSPQWQNGQISSYAALLLDQQAARFFFPLIIYSSACLIALLIKPYNFAGYFAIRLGIYTGVVLAFQYALILTLLGNSSIVAFYVIFVLLLAGFRLLKIPANTWASLVLGMGLFLLLITIYLASPINSFRELYYQLTVMPYFALVIILFLAPVLCFWVMARTAVGLFQFYEKPVILSFWRGAGLAVWLAAYTAAWALSIQKMFAIYAALPKEPPPDCYIATAAARGHPCLVGSYPTQKTGGTYRINRQLQTLKCAELALIALTPGLHSRLRKMYDTLGRPASRLLSHPILADLAYLSLKPIELLSRLILQLLVPGLDEYSARLYR
jgi:hypothetical protein